MLKIIKYVLCLSFMMTAGCASKGAASLYQPRFWAGDPSDSAIHRTQEKVKIACNDDIFKNYVCLSYDELALLFEGKTR